jgi:putative Mg2+ transporter-C (MgtC) family protein
MPLVEFLQERKMIEPILDDFRTMLPDAHALIRVVVRLMAALAVGALIGYQRERMGKAAGLRTHMLVSMGTTLLVVAPLESGMDDDGLSRVIQGLITGIGFLGAGTIMKIHDNKEIRGLTTAAGIWMTAAASVAIGLGQIGIGIIAALLAWLVLGMLHRAEPGRGTDPPRQNA